MGRENLDNLIDVIVRSNTRFSDLVDLVGLDPYCDFQNQDLSGIDFGSSDLHEFRFFGSILDNSDLSQCTLSQHTLRGVKSARNAKIPKIVDDQRTGKSTSVILSYADQSGLDEFFGSIRRAIIDTLSAASATNPAELDRALHVIGISGQGEYKPKDRRVSVKIPSALYETLSEISIRMNIHRTAALRLLLTLSLLSLANKTIDHVDSMAEFVDGFSKTMKQIRSDSPEQGFLF